MKLFLLIASFCFTTTAAAGTDHDHPAPKISAPFEKMKALVGTWEGTTKMSGKEQKMTVIYELTSGGTALVEKLGPGTPHEMVTVYANRGNDVFVTHYCALGNQPEMKLKKSTDNQFAFEMSGTKGLTNKNEMHMHAITLSLNNDKLKQEWTNYKDGKKGDVAVFEFSKKE